MKSKQSVELDSMHGLTCPSCNGSYLHHGKVSIFWRKSEDSDEHEYVKSDHEGTTTSKHPLSAIDNPSSRRSGMTIDFSCEICDAEPRLAIYQHKGTTYVKWQSMRQILKD